MQPDLLNPPDLTTVARVNGRPVRRLRGLRLSALPSWPLVTQVAGAAGVVGGVWHQWGWGIAAIVGGAGAVLVGMLREGGRI